MSGGGEEAPGREDGTASPAGRPRDPARVFEILSLLVIVVTLLLIGDVLFALLGLPGLILSHLLIFLLPVLLVGQACGVDLRGLFRVLPVRPLSGWAAALLMAPAMWVMATAFTEVHLRWSPLSSEESEAWATLEAEARDAPLLAVTALVVVPAVVEEVIFRGVLLRVLRRRLTAGRAVFVQALLFALIHRSAHRFVPQGALGYLLGHLALRAPSLGPCVLLHFLYNLGVLLLGRWLPDHALGWPALVTSAALLTSGGWLMRSDPVASSRPREG